MKRINFSDYETKSVSLPWQKADLQQTATGYGSKLLTTWKLKYNNQWHRIYMMCYSNSATSYILSKNEMIIVDD